MSASAFSQDIIRTDQQKAEQMTENLDKYLNLSNAQKTSITSINLKYIENVSAASKTASDATLKKRRQNQINDVLTNAQKAILRNPLKSSN